MARKLAIDADSLDSIECGLRVPSADALLRAIFWLRCDLDDLTAEVRR